MASRSLSFLFPRSSPDIARSLPFSTTSIKRSALPEPSKQYATNTKMMKKKVVHFLCAAAAHTTHMTCGWTELTDCLASCRASMPALPGGHFVEMGNNNRSTNDRLERCCCCCCCRRPQKRPTDRGKGEMTSRTYGRTKK